ncbi:hypothetical protein K439DRAFT_1298342, partial [Ramaria rubella]
WKIAPISKHTFEWGTHHGNGIHQCQNCGVILLTGERPGFCCGSGGNQLADVPPLPELPQEFDVFSDDENVSKLSRVLNLIYSFAFLEFSAEFPVFDGPPGFFAVEGKLFHR